MRRRLALVGVLLLAACGSSTGDGAAPPSPVTAVPVATGSEPIGTPVSSPPSSASAEPLETLGIAPVAGPAALTLLNDDGTVRWEAPATAGFTVGLQAVIGDGVVLAATYCDGPVAVKAWDVVSGAPLWSAVLPNSLGGTVGLAIDGDVALVGSESAVLALDARTGQSLWQADQVLWGAGGDTVVVANPADLSRDFIGLDLATGAERWHTRFTGGSFVIGMVTDGARAYATVDGTPPSRVAAIDLADGTELWRVPLSAGTEKFDVEVPGGLVIGSPVDSAGVATAALDGASGTEAWRASGWKPIRGARGVNLSGDGNIYVGGAEAGTLAALDVQTGAQRWSKTAAELGGASNVFLMGAATGGVVVRVDDQTVKLDAADGSERWRAVAPSQLLAAGEGAIAFAPECATLGD